ncbi:MAG: helix-turn-helix domain-containing protein, partial [Pseudolabrys sp.]
MQGGGETTDPPSLRSGETSLTARARALYEGSAVPVREIARLAGVSERTLYKYVEKYRWKKRYARVP